MNQYLDKPHSDLVASWRFYRSAPMTAEEERAALMLRPVQSPLGLADWRTTDGQLYGKGANAIDAQVGINRRAAAEIGRTM